jgi:hypothetical protein
MPWTRRQFITEAFSEIGIGSDFSLSADMLESARVRLDAMMAEWNGRGLRLGYPIGANPTDGDLDDVTNVPDSANEAVFLNLAIKIAPSFGRTLMPETKASARTALNTVSLRNTLPPVMQFPSSLPRGAGQKPYRNDTSPFFPEPTDPLLAGEDGEISFD